MGTHIRWKAELENMTASLLKQACLIKVHHCSNVGTSPTDELPSECLQTLTQFEGLFGKSTCANLQQGRQANLEVKTNPNSKILFCSLYRISASEEAMLRWQTEKAICCGWIQLVWSNVGSPVLFERKVDHTLHMCIDYPAVNAITVNDCYVLPHIEDLPNSIFSCCLFTQLDLAAAYYQICIATADRQMMVFTIKFALYESWVLHFGLVNAPSQFMRMMHCILEPMISKFIIVYMDDIVIHRQTLAEHVVHSWEVLTKLAEQGLKGKCAKWA